MNRYGKTIGFFAGLILLAILCYFTAPMIGRWVNAHLISAPSSAQTVQEKNKEKNVGEFLTSLSKATQYSFSGTKRITGAIEPFNQDFSCSVNGDDYTIQTVKDGQTSRQLYVKGKYSYVEDTALKVYKDVQKIGFPITDLKDALTGKLIRVTGEIINGNHVNCIELYKNSTVYAFYVNQQGVLVRYYYIFDGNEVTVDFTKFIIGNDKNVSFDVPANYTPGTVG